MSSNLDRFKGDLDRLIRQGSDMLVDVAKDKDSEKFDADYQSWYTEACAVIGHIIPGRLKEFESYYKADTRRKSMTLGTYTIQDWLRGLRAGRYSVGNDRVFDDHGAVVMLYKTQFQILLAVQSRFESSLFDIRQLVQADLFDSELDGGRELLRKGFLRAAGAIAGVVLEKHLRQVCTNHGITIQKREPGIGDLNDALKNQGVTDVPRWRQIQRLGDLRNLCDHNKDREPLPEEVTELLDGVEKVIKTLY